MGVAEQIIHLMSQVFDIDRTRRVTVQMKQTSRNILVIIHE